ncbi:MAG: N-acetylmuramoyl-L-alanine amidase, partial [Actinomycetota bacterium]|nr:N-acetylmuramoyl-L-alanine amidase [Actinomycetota bacterium]
DGSLSRLRNGKFILYSQREGLASGAVRLLAGFAAGALVGAGGLTGRAGAQGAQVAPVEVTERLSIRPRAAWAGDGPAPDGLVPEDVRFLLLHHSAGDTDHKTEQVPAILQGYHAFHTGPTKGWPDLAYNFLIDREGGVWEGRAGSIAGAVRGDATGGNQGYSQLVCLIGDFTAAPPTDAAIDAAARTLAWLADRSGIETAPGSTATFDSLGSSRWPVGTQVETATIAGHRDMSHTACPGDTFYPIVVGELPAAVTAARALRNAAPAPTASPSTTSEPTSSVVPPTEAGTAPAATDVPPAPPTVVEANGSSTSVAGQAADASLSSGPSLLPWAAIVPVAGLAAAGAVVAGRRARTTADADEAGNASGDWPEAPVPPADPSAEHGGVDDASDPDE